eukprot:CAMPEP_0169472774 /NCGR_PEP_ID=MMETSP1042-20121227/25350_1 /TAXON_ID=464988 /ORGANISM="Hemiselmis andersenii, Strain CCMP1180" /LENGTH=230 /DNA_ID=CAMNT_0009586655 /DNA_START=61 /DNA_END=750 /DNA_ORIENTATION=+
MSGESYHTPRLNALQALPNPNNERRAAKEKERERPESSHGRPGSSHRKGGKGKQKGNASPMVPQYHGGLKGVTNRQGRADLFPQKTPINFEFPCDGVPDGQGDKIVLTIETPQNESDRQAIWAKMQKLITDKFKLHHCDLAVFTFKGETMPVAVVVNNIQFSDLLCLNAENPKESFGCNWKKKEGQDEKVNHYVFRYKIKLAHSILIPPTLKHTHDLSASYPAPLPEEVR